MNDADLRFKATLEDEVSPKVQKLEAELKKLGASPAEIKMTLKAYDEATAKAQQVQRELNRLPNEHLVKVRADTSQFDTQIKGVQKAADDNPVKLNFLHNLDDVGNKFFNLRTKMSLPLAGGMGGGAATGMLYGLGAGGLAAGVASAGLGMVKQGVDLNAQLEQSMVTLTQTMRDQSKAQEEMRTLQGLAQSTPFQYQDLLQADVRLRSYQIPTLKGEGGPNDQGWLKAAGDMAAGMGTPITQAVEAIADARQGYFVRMMTYGIRMMREDFQKGGKFQGLSYEEGLARALKRFEGAQEMQSKTFQGIMSNLKDIMQLQVIKPIGQIPFEAAKQAAGSLYESLNDPDTLRAMGSAMEKLQLAQAQFFEKLKEGKAVFETNYQGPLGEIVKSLIKLGAAFAQTFGGTAATVIKTFADGLVLVLEPIAKIAGSMPVFAQVYGTFKALSLLGFGGLFEPFQNFAKMLNPLNWTFGNLMKTLGSAPKAAALGALALLVKHLIDATTATRAFNNEFSRLNSYDSQGLDKFRARVSSESLIKGNGLVDTLNLATATGQALESVPSIRNIQDRKDSTNSVMDFSLNLQRRLGGDAVDYAQMIAETMRVQGTNERSSAREIGIATGALQKLGVEADNVAATFNSIKEAASEAGLSPGYAAAGLAAVRRGVAQSGTGELTDNQARLYGNTTAMYKSLAARYQDPSVQDLNTLIRTQRISNPSAGLESLSKYYDFKTVKPERLNEIYQQFQFAPGTATAMDEQYQANTRAAEEAQRKINKFLPKGIDVNLPQFANPYVDNGIMGGLEGFKGQVPNLQGRQPGASGPQMNPNTGRVNFLSGAETAKTAYTNLMQVSDALDNLNSEIERQQNLITQTTTTQVNFQMVTELVGVQMQKYQHQIQAVSRQLQDQQLAMTEYQFNTLRPLERQMARLGNETARVSYQMSLAQREMDQYSKGLFTGEQAALNQLHALERYNKELQLLKLNYTQMGAELGRETYTAGFESRVAPMAGISLELQMERASREQQRRQLQYDLTYGEQRYRLQQAQRSRYERQELPFGVRLDHVKNARGEMDRLTEVQYRLQDQQYTLGQAMFFANEKMQDMQDAATGLQIRITKMNQSHYMRDLEDSQYRLSMALGAVNRQLEIQQINLEKSKAAMDDYKEQKDTLLTLLDSVLKPKSGIGGIEAMLGFAQGIKGGLTVEQANKSLDSLTKAVGDLIGTSKGAGGVENDPRNLFEKISGAVITGVAGFFNGDNMRRAGNYFQLGTAAAYGQDSLQAKISKPLSDIASFMAQLYAGYVAIQGILQGSRFIGLTAVAGALNAFSRVTPQFSRGLLSGTDKLLSGLRSFSEKSVEIEGGFFRRISSLGKMFTVGAAGKLTESMSETSSLYRTISRARSDYGNTTLPGQLTKAYRGPLSETVRTVVDPVRAGKITVGGVLGGVAGNFLLGDVLGPLGAGVGALVGQMLILKVSITKVLAPLGTLSRAFGSWLRNGNMFMKSIYGIGRALGLMLRPITGFAGSLGRLLAPLGTVGTLLGRLGGALLGVFTVLDLINVANPNASPESRKDSGIRAAATGLGYALGLLIAKNPGGAMLGGQLGQMGGAFLASKFQTGTPYVGEDGPAYLHKGEAVLNNPMADMWRRSMRKDDLAFNKASSQLNEIQFGIKQSDDMDSTLYEIQTKWKQHNDIMVRSAADSEKEIIDTSITSGERVVEEKQKTNYRIENVTDKSQKKQHKDTQDFYKGQSKMLKNYAEYAKNIVQNTNDTMGNFKMPKIGLGGGKFGVLSDITSNERAAQKEFGRVRDNIWNATIPELRKLKKALSQAFDRDPSLKTDETRSYMSFINSRLNDFRKLGQGIGVSRATQELQAAKKAMKDYNESFQGKGTAAAKGILGAIPFVGKDVADFLISDSKKEELQKNIREAGGKLQKELKKFKGIKISPSKKDQELDNEYVQAKIKQLTRVREKAKDSNESLTIDERKALQNRISYQEKWFKDSKGVHDAGWKDIARTTENYLGKISKAVFGIDKSFGIVHPGDKKDRGIKDNAHGGLIEGGKISEGQLIRVGEEGFDEVVIPLAPHRRNRAISLLRQTSKRLGSTREDIQHFANGGMVIKEGTPGIDPAYYPAKAAYDAVNAYENGGFTEMEESAVVEEYRNGGIARKRKKAPYETTHDGIKAVKVIAMPSKELPDWLIDKIPMYAAGGFTGPSGSLAGLGPLARFAQRKFGLSVTAGRTDHSKYTSGGNISNHFLGTALDLSNGTSPTPQMGAFYNFGLRKIPQTVSEMIYKNMMFDNGSSIGYGGSDHYNHVHIALYEQYAKNATLMANILARAAKGLSIASLLRGGFGGEGGGIMDIPDVPKALKDMGPVGVKLYQAFKKKLKKWQTGGGGMGGGPAPSVSGAYNVGQLTQLASSVGMPNPRLMAAIAMAESSGNPSAHGPPDGRGLWQIEWPVWGSTLGHLGNPYNPLANAKMAKEVLKQQGLGAWVVYNTGAYQQFMPHAGGLPYVPRDNYPALLHQGEKVVPAGTSQMERSRESSATASGIWTQAVKKISEIKDDISDAKKTLRDLKKGLDDIKDEDKRRRAERRIERLEDKIWRKNKQMTIQSSKAARATTAAIAEGGDESGGEETEAGVVEEERIYQGTVEDSVDAAKAMLKDDNTKVGKKMAREKRQAKEARALIKRKQKNGVTKRERKVIDKARKQLDDPGKLRKKTLDKARKAGMNDYLDDAAARGIDPQLISSITGKQMSGKQRTEYMDDLGAQSANRSGDRGNTALLEKQVTLLEQLVTKDTSINVTAEAKGAKLETRVRKPRKRAK